MPRVTVVVPTVSRIAFLREALASVESQTYRDFEIVIGDNSASPDYAAAVDHAASEIVHVPVRVHHHPRNLGMTGNANFLIDAAEGEFWLYLPDDDRMLPRCLETLVAALDSEPTAGLAFSDHFLIDAAGRPELSASRENSRRYGRTGLHAGFHERADLYALALAQVFELQSMLFRRSIIRQLRFREEAGPIPDLDLQLRLWRASMQGVVYCPDRLNEYRVHAGQATGSGDPRAALAAIVRALEDTVPDGSRSSPLYRARLASNYASLSMLEAQEGNGVEAVAYARRAMDLDPRSWKVRAARGLSVAPAAVVRTARAAFGALRKVRSRLH